jgi:hypothetical protein
MELHKDLEGRTSRYVKDPATWNNYRMVLTPDQGFRSVEYVAAMEEMDTFNLDGTYV